MVFIAIANGAFRQFIFARVMPELRAHQVSTVLGSVLIGLYIWMIVHMWPPSSPSHALLIGLVWLVLTVAFECIFGRFAMHHSWEHLLQHYNVLKGRLWGVFLIWLTLAPYVFFRICST